MKDVRLYCRKSLEGHLVMQQLLRYVRVARVRGATKRASLFHRLISSPVFHQSWGIEAAITGDSRSEVKLASTRQEIGTAAFCRLQVRRIGIAIICNFLRSSIGALTNVRFHSQTTGSCRQPRACFVSLI
jgi:hypothetical protein